MRTVQEIQDKLHHIREKHSLDNIFQRGRYDALQWVLEGTSGTEKSLEEKELEAEIEVFTNLHDAFINVNNSLIRHGHTDVFKEYLFDDAISALTKLVIVKENKLRERREKK